MPTYAELVSKFSGTPGGTEALSQIAAQQTALQQEKEGIFLDKTYGSPQSSFYTQARNLAFKNLSGMYGGQARTQQAMFRAMGGSTQGSQTFLNALTRQNQLQAGEQANQLQQNMYMQGLGQISGFMQRQTGFAQQQSMQAQEHQFQESMQPGFGEQLLGGAIGLGSTYLGDRLGKTKQSGNGFESYMQDQFQSPAWTYGRP